MANYTIDPNRETEFESPYAKTLKTIQSTSTENPAPAQESTTSNVAKGVAQGLEQSQGQSGTEKAGSALTSAGAMVTADNPYVGVPMMAVGTGLSVYGAAKSEAYKAKLARIQEEQRTLSSLMRQGSVL